MLRIVLCAAFGLLLACGTRAAPDPNADPVSAHLVPPPQSMTWDVVMSDTVPVIDHPHYVMMAIDLLLQMEGSPELSTEDDRLIFAQLKAHRSGAAPINIVFATGLMPGGGSTPLMAYSCELGAYVIPAGMRMPIVQLATAVYHEALHAADCRQLRERDSAKLGEHGPSLLDQGKSVCQVEYRAHAAGIRVFLVLQNAMDLPIFLSSQDPRGRYVVDSVMEAWPVLYENHFCTWYKEKFPHQF